MKAGISTDKPAIFANASEVIAISKSVFVSACQVTVLSKSICSSS